MSEGRSQEEKAAVIAELSSGAEEKKELEKFSEENQHFYLRNGKRMDISVNFHTRKLVLAHCDIDLFGVLGDESLLAKVREPTMFFDILFLVCDESCQEHGIEDEDFGRNIDGKAFNEAVSAFEVALVNFGHRGQGELLKKVFEKEARVREAVEERAIRNLDNPKVDEMLNNQLEQLDKSFESALESLEVSPIQEG